MGIELELAPDIALIAILIYGTLLTLLVWAGVILVFAYASLQSRKEGTNGSGRTADGSGECGGRSGGPRGPQLVHSAGAIQVVKKEPTD